LQDLEAEVLRVRFVSQGDPSGQEMFGSDYWTNAIQVTVGDVLLARRQADPSTVYAIQIAAQEGDVNTTRSHVFANTARRSSIEWFSMKRRIAYATYEALKEFLLDLRKITDSTVNSPHNGTKPEPDGSAR
jgi:hypothetical protein